MNSTIDEKRKSKRARINAGSLTRRPPPSRPAASSTESADERDAVQSIVKNEAEQREEKVENKAPPLRKTDYSVPPDELEPLLERMGCKKAMVTLEDIWDIDNHLSVKQSINERCIYRMMFRQSYGEGRTHCIVSLPQCEELSHLSRHIIQQGLKGLKKKGHIQKVKRLKGRVRGVVYRVNMPREIMGEEEQ